MEDVLRIENLRISFDVYGGTVKAVRGVSLGVQKGEIVALVGESGCGKSVTAQEVMGLNPMPPAKLEGGKIFLCNKELTGLSEKEAREYRRERAGMVFQNPMTALNPSMKIGKQITETLRYFQKLPEAACQKEAVRLLGQVHITEPALRARQYPHQLSGGMRQRVLIAMALAHNPELLIADEPTTALDVTIQLEILRLFYEIRKSMGTAVLFITHDLSVVANLADRVFVMYGGKIVEGGSTKEVFDAPAHPYTQGLLGSLAASEAGGTLAAIPGTPPDLFAPPKGCGFAPRCPLAMCICQKEEPPAFTKKGEHQCACWRQHGDFVGKEDLR